MNGAIEKLNFFFFISSCKQIKDSSFQSKALLERRSSKGILGILNYMRLQFDPRTTKTRKYFECSDYFPQIKYFKLSLLFIHLASFFVTGFNWLNWKRTQLKSIVQKSQKEFKFINKYSFPFAVQSRCGPKNKKRVFAVIIHLMV
jgi:hypothetical protein